MCPEQTAIRKQTIAIVEKHVAQLPAKQSVAVTFRMHGMKFGEIATRMGCPYNTAKANYRHGIMNLRKQLTGL